MFLKNLSESEKGVQKVTSLFLKFFLFDQFLLIFLEFFVFSSLRVNSC